MVSDCTVINSTEFGVSCNIVDGMGMQELAHKQEYGYECLVSQCAASVPVWVVSWFMVDGPLLP